MPTPLPLQARLASIRWTPDLGKDEREDGGVWRQEVRPLSSLHSTQEFRGRRHIERNYRNMMRGRPVPLIHVFDDGEITDGNHKYTILRLLAQKHGSGIPLGQIMIPVWVRNRPVVKKDEPPAQDVDYMAGWPKHMRPDQLARPMHEIVDPHLLAPGTPRKTFSDQEISNIERRHGLTEAERLPRKVHADGTVSTKVEDFHRWLDLIHTKLGNPETQKLFNDPTVSPHEKAFHLVTYANGEMGAILSRMNQRHAKQWYGASVKDWDQGITALAGHLGHEGWLKNNKTNLGLLKALVAFTSGDTNPTINGSIAWRMADQALHIHPTEPFKHIPLNNHEEFHEWAEKAGQVLGMPVPHFTKVTEADKDEIKARSARVLNDMFQWHRTHGRTLEKAKLEPGFAQMTVMIDRESGRPIAIKGTKDTPPKLWPGIGPKHAEEILKAKRTRDVKIPLVGTDGHLRPKGFGKQDQTIQSHVTRLRRLVGDLGPKGALEFLDNPQPVARLRERHPGFSWGAMHPTDMAPGSFIFGPKFGAFYQNLRGNKTPVVVDKWISRNLYRLTGTLIAAKRGKPLSPDGPRVNPRDARIIGDVIRRVAEHHRMSPADVQANWWDATQRFYNLFGVRSSEDNYSIAVQNLLTRHGLEPSSILKGK